MRHRRCRPKLLCSATWAKIACKVGSPPLPLSIELVHQVSAALRAAGYKAAGAYVNEALQTRGARILCWN